MCCTNIRTYVSYNCMYLCCISIPTYMLCKCMYLRVVEQFPVLFVPPATLNKYIQLCDDLVLKLQTNTESCLSLEQELFIPTNKF